MVTIKDLEMPKSCYNCPIAFGDLAAVCHRCAITMENINDYRNEEKGKRHPKCPLIEVNVK